MAVSAAILLAGNDVKIAARPLGRGPQSAKLRRGQCLHDSRVRPGRFVVRQDAPVADVFRLHQVENGLIVGIGLPAKVQMRIAGSVAVERQAGLIRQLDLERLVLPGADRRARDFRPIFESLPNLDPRGSRWELDLEVAPRIKEPAQIADRRLPLAIAQARLWPAASQRVRREIILLGVIEVAIGAEDIHPTKSRRARPRVAHGDLQPAGVRGSFEDCLPGLVEAGGRKQHRLVVAADVASAIPAGKCRQPQHQRQKQSDRFCLQHLQNSSRSRRAVKSCRWKS